jgi:hypothetical protein
MSPAAAGGIPGWLVNGRGGSGQLGVSVQQYHLFLGDAATAVQRTNLLRAVDLENFSDLSVWREGDGIEFQ